MSREQLLNWRELEDQLRKYSDANPDAKLPPYVVVEPSPQGFSVRVLHAAINVLGFIACLVLAFLAIPWIVGVCAWLFYHVGHWYNRYGDWAYRLASGA